MNLTDFKGKPLRVKPSQPPIMVYPLSQGWIWAPSHLIDEAMPWVPLLSQLPRLSKDPWILSSVKTGLSGSPRPNTSHDLIGALDLAPIKSFDEAVNSDGSSPRLYDNRLFTQLLLTKIVPKVPIAIYVEQDHLHFGFTNPPGVYLFRDYTKYSTDAGISSDLPRDLVQLDSRGGLTPVQISKDPLPLYTGNPFFRGMLL